MSCHHANNSIDGVRSRQMQKVCWVRLHAGALDVGYEARRFKQVFSLPWLCDEGAASGPCPMR